MPAIKGNRPGWLRLRAILGRALYLLKSMGSPDPCLSGPCNGNLAVLVKTLAPRNTQVSNSQILQPSFVRILQFVALIDCSESAHTYTSF